MEGFPTGTAHTRNNEVVHGEVPLWASVREAEMNTRAGLPREGKYRYRYSNSHDRWHTVNLAVEEDKSKKDLKN